jgi:metallo-beta-lactamase class B
VDGAIGVAVAPRLIGHDCMSESPRMTFNLTKLLAATAMVAAALGIERTSGQGNPEWTRPFPPFKMIGNIYWVGSYDLSTYLITTPQGHILINTGVGDTAQKIKASVEQLGFKMTDVKILTATHGHFDHVAGMAELKRLTGATLVTSEPEKELLESGGKADFRFGDTPSARFEPAKVDRTFKDGETLSLSGTTLTAHLHAGHTKGATSFTTDVRENGRTYRVVIANMGSINPGVTVTGMPNYPGILQDYARTFKAQKEMEIDVWFASHASQFRMHEKYKPGDSYAPDRFVDPKGFVEAVSRLEKAYLDQVTRERAGK